MITLIILKSKYQNVPYIPKFCHKLSLINSFIAREKKKWKKPVLVKDPVGLTLEVALLRLTYILQSGRGRTKWCNQLVTNYPRQTLDTTWQE